MYTTKEKPDTYVVSDSSGNSLYWFVYERPEAVKASGQKILEEYLAEAETIFKNKLQSLLKTDRTFTDGDQERLEQMLKLIIETRQTWQEEQDTPVRITN